MAAVALVATGCTSAQPQVAHPSRILQTVDTTLAADGAITGVADTTISVAASDASSSKTTHHDPAKVARDLPIRVTTQYSTAKKTGTDLSDLKGYTGRLEIDLTAENLTVHPQKLTYDVAGSSRTTPALVGSPFSIAASTVLKGTSPSAIVTESSDSTQDTDGVVSSDGKGNAVVQWATLLAPPTSGASQTLHLVADVKNFDVPSFDLAAQPGISTDLSSTGVLASAFDSGKDSELALQRRTIDLITNVNGVLARAGGTITEVRTNLESTSKTLGASTAQRLRDSSTSLAGTMQSLSGELGSLKGDLDTTAKATQSTVIGQLQTTVSSLDSLLGDTSATAPTATLDGQGCEAVAADQGQASSVYGSLLRVSSQLDGYADASEACKQQVSQQLETAVGPSDPTAATCTPDAPSLTCALFDSSTAVTGALIGLVGEGDALVSQLQPELAQNAIDSYGVLSGDLDSITTQLAALRASNGSTDDFDTALDNLRGAVASASDAIPAIRDQISAVHSRAQAARGLIGNQGDAFGSLQAQNSALANELCTLSGPLGRLTQEQVDHLRSYLTVTPCLGSDESQLTAPLGFSTPMDSRLADQATQWDGVVSTTDLGNSSTGLGAALSTLATRVSAIDGEIDDVASVVESGTGSVGSAVDQLQAKTSAARDAGGRLSSSLTQVKHEQDTLAANVKKAFADASSTTSRQTAALIAGQVRDVSAQAKTSRTAVVKAFDTSISGLRSTADGVTDDSKATIDGQRGKLKKETTGLASSVDEQTASSLSRIAASTDASTRDVKGLRRCSPATSTASCSTSATAR
ncbi:hypothetical protein [Frondihabitans sucicola]|uniref:hypothetical protein n=1 Tax=Frondihabitans sucicola TaxID=1268041 RepID=UPI0025729C70|nr:hypothetical protein [Frondihabitans sucicola]